MIKNKLISPFLKWVGGKRQLLTEINKFKPQKYNTYYEPFVGGGAVFFDLQRKDAVINDLNSELINVYKVINNDVDLLIDDLKTHKNESEYFYKIRALDRAEEFKNLSNIKRASRVIFLNKTCYNGLYRVNNSGEFNSPFGNYKNPNIVNDITLKAVSAYLNNNNIQILNTDYEEAIKDIKKGDFVYFDPPYYPLSNSSNFTGYIEGGFEASDQERLRNVCKDLDARGIKFLLSNSATHLITELYKEFHIHTVKANRFINSIAEKRGEIDEVLIRNYE